MCYIYAKHIHLNSKIKKLMKIILKPLEKQMFLSNLNDRRSLLLIPYNINFIHVIIYRIYYFTIRYNNYELIMHIIYTIPNSFTILVFQ